MDKQECEKFLKELKQKFNCVEYIGDMDNDCTDDGCTQPYHCLYLSLDPLSPIGDLERLCNCINGGSIKGGVEFSIHTYEGIALIMSFFYE